MADVFISYHEKSAGELAAQIARTLEAGGISCWYAKRDIPPGGDFAWHIPPQIDACKVFLLILNENAQKSRHIESEVGLAFSRWNNREEITILPLEIENFKQEPWLRYYLIHTQKLTMSVLDAEHMQELAQQIARLLKRELKPSTLSQLQPSPTKIIKRGECGKNITYTLDEKGLLTISGEGIMRNSWWDRETNRCDTPWWNERKIISHVKIQHGVTVLGKSAFHGCAELTDITIPDSVISIESTAFYNCAKLISITIPNSVASIGHGAFYGCEGLTNVTIPYSVTSIGNSAFYFCRGLASVVIPNSVTSIGNWTFCDCTRLTNVYIPDSVTSIGCQAFACCNNLTMVTIPDSVTSIGVGAFADCTRLTSVHIPSKTQIENNAFPSWVRVERRP